MNVLQFWITDTFLQRHDLAHKPTLVLDLDEELLDEVPYHSALLNSIYIANTLPYCRTRRSQGDQAQRCTVSGYEVSILPIRLLTVLCVLCSASITHLCLLLIFSVNLVLVPFLASADPFPNAGRFSLPTHSECLLLLFRYSGLQFLWSTLFGVPPAVRKRKEKSEKGQKKMEMGLLRPSSSREQVQVAGAAEVIRDEF